MRIKYGKDRPVSVFAWRTDWDSVLCSMGTTRKLSREKSRASNVITLMCGREGNTMRGRWVLKYLIKFVMDPIARFALKSTI